MTVIPQGITIWSQWSEILSLSKSLLAYNAVCVKLYPSAIFLTEKYVGKLSLLILKQYFSQCQWTY